MADHATEHAKLMIATTDEQLRLHAAQHGVAAATVAAYISAVSDRTLHVPTFSADVAFPCGAETVTLEGDVGLVGSPGMMLRFGRCDPNAILHVTRGALDTLAMHSLGFDSIGLSATCEMLRPLVERIVGQGRAKVVAWCETPLGNSLLCYPDTVKHFHRSHVPEGFASLHDWIVRGKATRATIIEHLRAGVAAARG